MRYSSFARAVARVAYPYSKVRRVWRGPARGLRFVVESGMGLTYAWGDLGTGTGFLERQIRRGASVWDIGANRGQVSLILARLVGATGSVVSVEPAPEPYESLVRNVQLNNLKQVRTIAAAVGRTNGSVVFTYHGARPTQGKMRDVEPSYENPGADEFLVRTITMDSLLDSVPAPDVIKIDVEGAAGVVLAGARRLISEVRPRIYLELHGPEEEAAVRDALFANGYRGESITGMPVKDPTMANPLWCVPG